MSDWLNRVKGHFWTVWPHLFGSRPLELDSIGRAWSHRIDEGEFQGVEGAGRFYPVEGARTLAIVIHGLGATPDSGYVQRMAHVCLQEGMSVLALALQGADGRSTDFYHAGYTNDLRAALADPAIQAFENRYVVGFSLGGHIALCAAIDEMSTQFDAVAAVCPPLSLRACQRAFDQPLFNPYRRHCLKGLKQTIRHVHTQRRQQDISCALPMGRLSSIRSIERWDNEIVAPRFGFADAHDYYKTVSVGARLEGLRVPCLVVSTTDDPMIPIGSIDAYLPHPNVDYKRLSRGGHVGFPAGLTLGFDGPPGLEMQLLAWFKTNLHGVHTSCSAIEST